jgi:imidazolonepropionase-like amidohydrolase
MTIAFVGGTLIDGTGVAPRKDSAIITDGARIRWIGAASELDRTDVEVIDVRGKYVVPGLLDANTHLFAATEPEYILSREIGWYDDYVLEAAQVALKAGVTTVFDTWGPLDALKRVRDRINGREAIGCRIYCAGNIIGDCGPWSEEFAPEFGASFGKETVDRVNAVFEQGVGCDLLWMWSEDVRLAVREYIATSGIDFVKYSSSAHKLNQYIAFSPDSQRAIVEEAHAAGMTAQACTQGIEALKMTIAAGADLLQHGDITGRNPMPLEVVELIVDRQIPCVAFLMSQTYLDSLPQDLLESEAWLNRMAAKETNDLELIRRGAKLLLAHDMCIYSPRTRREYRKMFDVPDQPRELGESHVTWLKAAVERGMAPMAALLAATRNIAEAYHRYDDIGSIEPGKFADMLVLDADPLADSENYRRIVYVVKEGVIIDRDRMPERPLLTAELAQVSQSRDA